MSWLYDHAMDDRGFVMCLFESKAGRVVFSYEKKIHAGEKIGEKVYQDGSVLRLHAVKHYERISRDALRRLVSMRPLSSMPVQRNDEKEHWSG